jgi:hypothetical protein
MTALTLHRTDPARRIQFFCRIARFNGFIRYDYPLERH